MKPSSPIDPVLKRFLSRIPTHIAVTFSEEQLQEIEKQLRDRQWTVHPVDVRLSFPILGRYFYLVIIAGRERRQQSRSPISERSSPLPKFNFSYLSNLLACATFILILIPALLGLSYLYTSIQSEENQIPSALEQRIDRLLNHWGL